MSQYAEVWGVIEILANKGWTKVPSNGDAAVSAFGKARDTLTSSPEKNTKKLDDAVEHMFKNFPPNEKGWTGGCSVAEQTSRY